MMHRYSLLALAAAAFLAGAQRARAQSGDSSAARDSAVRRASARDSLFQRARRLVVEGNGDAGRAVVDSALAATEGTPAYADALYWRAALAATAADAERDYRRVIVDYPFSEHAGDALLALAQLEMARGERGSAIDHLQRFLLVKPNAPERVRAGVWLGRMLLDDNQLAKGCGVLLRTRAAVSPDSVETRNQVDYYASRCDGVDTTTPPSVATATATGTASGERRAASGAKADSAKHSSVRRDRTGKRDSARRETGATRDSSTKRDSIEGEGAGRDSAKRDAAKKDSAVPALAKRDSAKATPGRRDTMARPTASGRYTVQLAAYETRDSAEQLVSKLASRGISARIIMGPKPTFRVRVGQYATEAEALAAARDLKARGMSVFVTTTDIERPPAPGRR